MVHYEKYLLYDLACVKPLCAILLRCLERIKRKIKNHHYHQRDAKDEVDARHPRDATTEVLETLKVPLSCFYVRFESCRAPGIRILILGGFGERTVLCTGKLFRIHLLSTPIMIN